MDVKYLKKPTKRNELLDKINDIVKKSFGKKFRGDCFIGHDGGDPWYGGGHWEHIFDRPLMISKGKPRSFFFNESRGFYEPVGQLGYVTGEVYCNLSKEEADGSVIVVNYGHEDNAKTYAKLYEEIVKKDTKVIVTDKDLNIRENFGFNMQPL